MLNFPLVIIGGGPAGLCAAKIAAEAGQKVLLIDRNPRLGGQLIKQTHMFFGSEKQYAKTRGFDIARQLIATLGQFSDLVEIWTDATVVGVYPDFVVTVYRNHQYQKIQAQAIIVATGASEKVLTFENNDLPGIYGAGAIQTLMNVYGVKPGQQIIMVGSGNIGLIVSYQLLQAGVKVLAILEAAPSIGGYKVHASKVRRLGVEICTSRTIKKAIGKDAVEKVITIGLDDKWQERPGSEREFTVDAVGIAVGLTPLTNILGMMGVKMKFVSELGGLVPITNEHHETSVPNLFVCGDASGIEEASSAIVEGTLAGLVACEKLRKPHPKHQQLTNDYQEQLQILRQGPFGAKICQGLAKLGDLEDVK
ncbi:MAG: NAD(P)/FAD-dependent oxidoreductase [Bacilli bacterium]